MFRLFRAEHSHGVLPLLIRAARSGIQGGLYCDRDTCNRLTCLSVADKDPSPFLTPLAGEVGNYDLCLPATSGNIGVAAAVVCASAPLRRTAGRAVQGVTGVSRDLANWIKRLFHLPYRDFSGSHRMAHTAGIEQPTGSGRRPESPDGSVASREGHS